jgi:erythromycin esterase
MQKAKYKQVFYLGIIIFTICVCLQAQTGEAGSDSKVQWLKDNAIPIRTTSPEDEDFSDLMPLVNKIGNASLVLLGEQSHGDGNVFLLKARLVRFLHMVMGFDVLAWESGLYDCSRMEDALHSEIPLEEAEAYGIFPIWALSEQVRPVFEYARSTYGKPKPLIMTGFDCQLSSARSATNFLSEIKAFFNKAQLESLSAESWDLFEEALDAQKLRNMTEEMRSIHKENLTVLLTLIVDSRAILSMYYGSGEIDFWQKVLSGYSVYFGMIEKMLSGGQPTVLDNNVRDAVMAQNLLWLVEEAFPHKKIVVWGATLHNMRRIDQVQTNKPSLSYEGLVTMGHPVFEKLKDAVYSIGFSTYQGKAGNVFIKKPYDIPPAPDNSLEEICHRTGHEMLFIDFRGTIQDEGHWFNQKLKARPLGHTVMDAIWPLHLDAMIFTDTVIPSTRIQKEDEEKNGNSK